MTLPAVPPALAILAGVVVGVFCDDGPGRGAGAAVWTAWLLAAIGVIERHARLAIGAMLGALALCGWTLGAQAARVVAEPPLRALLSDRLDTSRDSGVREDAVRLAGRLTEDVSPDPDGVRLSLDVETVETPSASWHVRGRVLLSVAGDVPSGATGGWRQGRLVRLPVVLRRATQYRNPGAADAERALNRRGIALVGTVKSALLVDIAAPASPVGEVAAWLRDRARRTLDEYVGRGSPRSSAVVRAVLLGDRAGLDQETTERLQQAGTYHVIAISGGNIAILTGLLMWGLRLTRVRTPVAETATALALLVYAWFVGGGASVVRATLMAVTYLTARAVDLRTPPVNAVAVAAGLLLAASPMSLFDPGTWLTFGATLGILHGVGGVLRRLPRLPWWLAGVLGLFLASLCAELVLFPISAFAFSRVTAAGLVVNFAAVPLMTIVQIGGIVTLVAAELSRAAADGCGFATHLAAWGLVESARFVDLAPWLTRRLPAPGVPAMIVYYGGLFVAARGWLRPGSAGEPQMSHAAACGRSGQDSDPCRGPGPGVRNTVAAAQTLTERDTPALPAVRLVRGTPMSIRLSRRTAGVAGTVALASAVWMVSAPHGGGMAPGRMRLTWMDVGQGDSALAELPGRKTLLIDAGGGAGRYADIGPRVIEPVVWLRGVRRLDYMSISHPDADHIVGAAALVRDLRPVEIWEGVPVEDLPLRAELLGAATEARAMWRTVQRGDRLAVGEARVTVWHPRAPDWARRRVRNDDSVVLEIRLGDVSIVLPGDIEAGAELELASLMGPAPLRIVQAPHHGSATSSTADWLDALAPCAIVVSAGRGNRYGHPHAAVLARASARGLPVFRTDRDGAVVLDTDGRVASLATVSGRSWRAGSASCPP